MKLLEGKVALITGAARGIGKAIALKYASEGCNVAFTDLVIDENGKKTEEEIAAFGVKAKGYASNAADFEATHNVVAEVVKDFGRIDILVNNAGITKDGLMMRMTEGQWDAVIGVNLKSTHRQHHQYGVCSWRAWKCRTMQLLSIQSRDDRSCQVYRSGTWITRNTRQCHCSGIHHHRYDGRTF